MAIFSISHSESGRKQLSLKSPVDLSHIDTYDCANSDEISAVMTQAKIAQSKWKQTSLKERVELMHRVADVVIQQQDRIMDVVMRETGKPVQEAMAMEVFSAVDSLVFYAKRAEKWLSDKKIKMHGPMRFLKKNNNYLQASGSCCSYHTMEWSIYPFNQSCHSSDIMWEQRYR